MPSITPGLWLCPNCETLNPLTSLKCEVCGEDIPCDLRPPIIKSFKSSATTVRDNENLTVSWKTEYATFAYLNDVFVPSNGEKTILATEIICLRAVNANGRDERSLNITVLYIQEINDFTISKTEMEFGEKCKISWKPRNIKSVLFNGEAYDPNASISFQPKESGLYSVSFEGVNGTVIRKDFNIKIIYKPISINKLETDRDKVKKGKSCCIKWSSENVSYVTINGKRYNASDFCIIRPTEPITVHVKFHGLDGTETTRVVKIDVIQNNEWLITLIILLLILIGLLSFFALT